MPTNRGPITPYASLFDVTPYQELTLPRPALQAAARMRRACAALSTRYPPAWMRRAGMDAQSLQLAVAAHTHRPHVRPPTTSRAVVGACASCAPILLQRAAGVLPRCADARARGTSPVSPWASACAGTSAVSPRASAHAARGAPPSGSCARSAFRAMIARICRPARAA